MRIVFFGTPEFAVQSLDAILQSPHHEVASVVTIPDRQAGRGQKVIPSPVKLFALQHRLPVLQPEKLRNPDFLLQLQSLQADIFVVVAFRMLPEAVWAMPPLGTFNLHASLLPRYRGAAPINWAIINGEQQTGLTTFLLNHHIDEGNILLQQSTPIAPSETAGSLHDRLALMGRSLTVQTLDALANHTISPTPQSGSPCPAPKLFKNSCRIDFNRSAFEVDRFVRGLSPYPAAFTTLLNPSGSPVDFKIFNVAPILSPHNYAPGTLVCNGKNDLKFATNDGFVKILQIQMAGKKQNRTEDFLRGNNLIGWISASQKEC